MYTGPGTVWECMYTGPGLYEFVCILVQVMYMRMYVNWTSYCMRMYKYHVPDTVWECMYAGTGTVWECMYTGPGLYKNVCILVQVLYMRIYVNHGPGTVWECL